MAAVFETLPVEVFLHHGAWQFANLSSADSKDDAAVALLPSGLGIVCPRCPQEGDFSWFCIEFSLQPLYCLIRRISSNVAVAEMAEVQPGTGEVQTPLATAPTVMRPVTRLLPTAIKPCPPCASACSSVRPELPVRWVLAQRLRIVSRSWPPNASLKMRTARQGRPFMRTRPQHA